LGPRGGGGLVPRSGYNECATRNGPNAGERALAANTSLQGKKKHSRKRGGAKKGGGGG